MYLPDRDVIATGLEATAGLLYLLWAIGCALPGMSSSRATGVAALALGSAASASAVVPTLGTLRVITGCTSPLAAAARTCAERRHAAGRVRLPFDQRNSAERGSDHAD